MLPAADEARPYRDEERHDGREMPLEAPRGTNPDERSHKESQVEAADVDEEPFQDVRVSPQMGAPHPTGLVEMLTHSPAIRPRRRCGMLFWSCWSSCR